jgi:hypothetical protein
MLAEHIARAGAAWFAIKIMVADRIKGGVTFDHLEPIGGHQ